MSRELPRDGQRFDLIVVGAGINGTGIARDAAMRGLQVLLLDKGDLASGTTSWSSRLIHGGLRYLEHREFGLVRESLRERERLLQVAPHLVEPLPLLIPVYHGDRRGPLLIRAGMIAYDLLSYDKSLPRHRIFSRDATLRRAPGLKREGLRGAAMYFDAQVAFAERLAIENALDARDHGATVITYARADRLLTGDDGRTVRGIAYTDLVDGGVREALAPVTVNVAGPWVDRLLSSLDTNRLQPMIGGTKGSHIIVEPFSGAPRDALYVEAKRDGRPYFIIPWNGLYLIGTTDERYQGDLDQVVASEEEIQYLIDETNQTIPNAGLTRESVCYTYSGVRPLPYKEGGVEAAITRRHIVHDHAPERPGLFSVVGGKLTTYRNLAEQAVDAVFEHLGKPTPPSSTARTPLPGARLAGNGTFAARREISIAEMGRTRVSPETAERLFRVYGARAPAILHLAEEEPALWTPLCDGTHAIQAEVVFAVKNEMAQTLVDILLRRTMLGLGCDVGIGTDETVARVAQRFLGWTEERAGEEVSAYREYIRRFTPRLQAMSAH
jgi:glycerol-3-phosphate dehydrogenase